jgi:hypothetical protein
MTARPDLLVLAAELTAHLARARREAASIDELKSTEPPDRRTLWALAGHLQAFYTGCETVIIRALEKFEGLPPSGPDSHVRILQAASLDVPDSRPPVVSAETALALHPYRAFRHFFRHAYGVELVWDKMAAKVENASTVFDRFAQDLTSFIEFVRALASE